MALGNSHNAWVNICKDKAREVYEQLDELEIAIADGTVQDMTGAMNDICLVATQLSALKARLDAAWGKALREPIQPLSSR